MNNSDDKDEEMKEEIPLQKPKFEAPPFIPLNQVTSNQWIKVPLLTTLRKAGSYYQSRYESKEYVPRLLWLNLDWSLAQVH